MPEVYPHGATTHLKPLPDGSLVSGYNEQYHYDNRMADHPPPFFPTTGSHYDVLSWQRVVTPLP